MENQPSTPDTELPDWALSYAEAALRCGLKVGQIEATLIGKGLSPAVAASVVDRCVSNRCQGSQPPRRHMLTTVSRIASLIVAVGLLTPFGLAGDLGGLVWSACGMLLPLACIWFSEAFGNYVGPSYSSGMGNINRPTPGIFIAVGGWILLAGVPLLVFAVTRW